MNAEPVTTYELREARLDVESGAGVTNTTAAKLIAAIDALRAHLPDQTHNEQAIRALQATLNEVDDERKSLLYAVTRAGELSQEIGQLEADKSVLEARLALAEKVVEAAERRDATRIRYASVPFDDDAWDESVRREAHVAEADYLRALDAYNAALPSDHRTRADRYFDEVISPEIDRQVRKVNESDVLPPGAEVRYDTDPIDRPPLPSVGP